MDLILSQAIRRHKLPFQGLHLVHLDAHPDLSFPSTADASVVFDPQRLYELLDESESGIAEFLLPLLYAGHVNRLTFIPSVWSDDVSPCCLCMASSSKLTSRLICQCRSHQER